MKFASIGLLLLVMLSFSAYGKNTGQSVLTQASAGNVIALNSAFAKLNSADGGNAEDLEIAIGKSIVHSPAHFLSAVKTHRAQLRDVAGLTTNLGEAYVDQDSAQKREIKRRISALEQVRDPVLAPTKKECLGLLRSRLDKLEHGN